MSDDVLKEFETRTFSKGLRYLLRLMEGKEMGFGMRHQSQNESRWVTDGGDLGIGTIDVF